MRVLKWLAALALIPVIGLFVYRSGSPLIWGTDEFAALGTLLGGIAGPLAFIFAILQFKESKKAELASREEIQKNQALSDLQSAISRVSEKIDAILGQKDIQVSDSGSDGVMLNLGSLLSTAIAHIPENPVPNYETFLESAKFGTGSELSGHEILLLDRSSQITILLNRLLALALEYDNLTGSNIQSATLGDDYSRVRRALTTKKYPLNNWPQDTPRTTATPPNEKSTA